MTDIDTMDDSGVDSAPVWATFGDLMRPACWVRLC